MNKEQQDLVWLRLPKEIRDEIKEIYQAKVNSVYDAEIYQELILDEIFGLHNLTSDIEPEEILMVERKKVIEKFNKITNDYAETGDKWCSGYIKSLNDFFGDKCLPNKECVDLNKINQMLDETLEKETSESMKEWLDSQEEQPKLKFTKGDIVRNKLAGKIYKIYDGSGFYLLEDGGGNIKDGSVAEQYLEPYIPKIGDKVYYLGGGVKDKVYTILSVKGDMVEILPCHWVNVLSLKTYTEENKEPMEEKNNEQKMTEDFNKRFNL